MENNSNLLNFFKISLTEILLGFLSVAFIVYKIFIDVLATKYDEHNYLYELQQDYIVENVKKLDGPLTDSLVIGVLWAIVGLIIYTLVSLLISVLVDIKNDVEVSKFFIHPSSFHNSDFWFAKISRKAFILTAYLVIIAYVIYNLRNTRYVYEVIRGLVERTELIDVGSVFVALSVCVVWFFGWHMLVVFRRVASALTDKIG